MDTETITLTLPAEVVRSIREKVETGAYPSADAVVEDALQLLEEDEAETPEFNAHMRERVRQSLAEPGPDIPMDEVFDEIERHLGERR